MGQTKFIISSDGFLGDIKRLERGEKEYVWVDTIRKAKLYSLKETKKIIEESPIKCFIWAPFTKEPIKDKFMVVRREAHYDFFNDEDHQVLEWCVMRVHDSESDIKFLKNITATAKTPYYSFDEATEIAKQKNLKILNEITQILK